MDDNSYLQPMMYLHNLSSSSSSVDYTNNFPLSTSKLEHSNSAVNSSDHHHPEYQALQPYNTLMLGNQSMELADDPRSSANEQLVMYGHVDDNYEINNSNNVMMMRNSSSKDHVIGVNEADDSKGNTGGKKKMRKHRYAFQTRSQVDILDDGYRWRKYGQKAVKNNRFPRSYYRCTYQGCGVKKQVQRLSKDEAVVVTTYEGIHSHPIERSSDNFEHILSQMQIYTSNAM